MKKLPSLTEIAHLAMIEKGFIPDFPEPVVHEINALHNPASPIPPFRDMRDKLWISIDNDDSRDLDQITYAEKNKTYVAIADVDALVKPGSPIDAQAAHNTTSVYCPTIVFPMLPLKLSTDLTSLCENKDRTAIVIEMNIDSDGRFDLADIYPALVRNHAKLTYNGVGACLEHSYSCPYPIPSIQGLRDQLNLQEEIAERIYAFRSQEGALSFAEMELEAVVVDGIAVEIKERVSNKAHHLIENMMIAANVASTRFLDKRNLPSIRRIVKTPKKWDRIVALAKDLGEKLPSKPNSKALRKFLLKQQKASPLLFADLSMAIIKLIGRGEYVFAPPGKKGLIHFDLAEVEYSHTTAPNRRYPDLIMQRLLKSAIYNAPLPYTPSQLKEIAQQCTEKENDSKKVERRLIKCAAAMVLAKDVGKAYSAMVIGVTPKGTWVRLQNAPPIEGKLVHGFENVDVGDPVKVKLTKVDVMNGHIDFARM